MNKGPTEATTREKFMGNSTLFLAVWRENDRTMFGPFKTGYDTTLTPPLAMEPETIRRGTIEAMRPFASRMVKMDMRDDGTFRQSEVTLELGETNSPNWDLLKELP